MVVVGTGIVMEACWQGRGPIKRIQELRAGGALASSKARMRGLGGWLNGS